jgi:ABC-type anion transport system duplicated permease subunit
VFWRGPSFLTVVWIVIGVIVAYSHDYFKNLETVKQIASALLAVILWPLLLIGINLHIR